MPASLRQFLSNNPILQRVLKNSGYLFSATGISALISMVQGIITARMLGVALFGILGAITVFTSVINRFVSFRMSELVVRYVGLHTEKEEPQKAATVFKAAALTEMGASMIAFGLIWLLAPLGARYLAKDPHTSIWFGWYGAIALANLISESSTGLLQITDRFRRMAWLQVAQSLITLIFIGVAYWIKSGLPGVLLAYIFGKTFGALGYTYAALREAAQRWGEGWWKNPLKLLDSEWRELLHFAISTNISSSLSLINKDSELLWISLLRNPVETGYYKLALSLSNLVQMPISPLPQTTYTELTRAMVKKDWGNVRKLLKQGSFLAGGYSLVATLGLWLLGKPIITWLYTSQYLPAYPALLILLAGFLVANTFYWQRVGLLAIGRPEFPAQVNFVLAMLKIAGIFWLVPKFGYLANAGLLAGSYILGVSVSVVVFYLTLQQRQQFSPKEVTP